MGRKEIFTKIYDNNVWAWNQWPKSGEGSHLNYTSQIRHYLDFFCKEKEIKTIVDLGCGDLTWMPTTEAFSKCSYTGVDIVSSLIDSHTEKYPQHTFLCADVLEDNLPEGDLAIIRDIIFHMKHDEVAAFLKRVADKYKYFFITSCCNSVNSTEMTHSPGHYHPINLFIEPFSFKEYEHRIYELVMNRYVYVFTQEQMMRNIAPEILETSVDNHEA